MRWKRYRTGKQIRDDKLKKAVQARLKKAMSKKKRKTPTLHDACYFLRKGMCCFLAAHPEEPNCICPNWCTFIKSIVRKYGKSKHVTNGFMDWSDLMQNKRYKHLLIRTHTLQDKEMLQVTF